MNTETKVMKWRENCFAICLAPGYQEKPSSGRGGFAAFSLTCVHESIVSSVLYRWQRPNNNHKNSVQLTVGSREGRQARKQTNSLRMPTLFLFLETELHNIQRFLQKFMSQSNAFPYW